MTTKLQRICHSCKLDFEVFRKIFFVLKYSSQFYFDNMPYTAVFVIQAAKNTKLIFNIALQCLGINFFPPSSHTVALAK